MLAIDPLENLIITQNILEFLRRNNVLKDTRVLKSVAVAGMVLAGCAVVYVDDVKESVLFFFLRFLP